MFRFGSIKRLVSSSSKVLTKNTTRMGGDFLSNLKGLALLLLDTNLFMLPKRNIAYSGSLDE